MKLNPNSNPLFNKIYSSSEYKLLMISSWIPFMVNVFPLPVWPELIRFCTVGEAGHDAVVENVRNQRFDCRLVDVFGAFL